MNKNATTIMIFCVGLTIGAAGEAAVYTKMYPDQKANAPVVQYTLAPVTEGDMRAIVEALQPFEYGTQYTGNRARICIAGHSVDSYYEHRSVEIEFHPGRGTTLSGTGDDINAAIGSIIRQSNAAEGALLPFMKQK